jgi:hypothetical protein
MTRKATVEVTDIFEIEVDDDVLKEVMSEDWQKSFYTFRSEDEALAWLAWVVDENCPREVDGLVGFTDSQIRVRHVDQDREVVSW